MRDLLFPFWRAWWHWRPLARIVIAVALVLAFAPRGMAGDYYCQQGDRHPCDTTTTTTLPTTTTVQSSTSSLDTTTTTTSIPEDTTTSSTLPATTTTAPTESTTTQPLTTMWDASSECDTLTATFGEGITQVNVFLQDPQFGEIEVNAVTYSGEVKTTGIAAEWVLVPVVVNGYEPLPEQITVFTETCVTTTVQTGSGDTTTTIATTTTIDPGQPELPFTGPEGLIPLAIAGVASLGYGIRLVRSRRDG